MFAWLRRDAQPADGASSALEAIATGISPRLLDDVAGAPPAVSRRERMAEAGSAVIVETLGGKLLHGWLQNRHQTLMPLTLNLAFMQPIQRSRFAQTLASILLAGRPLEAVAEFSPVLRNWLAGLGGDLETLSAYDDAIEAPLPLNVLFENAQTSDLTIYAYVAALMASDARYPVSIMLCDLVQARFDLPSALVRSAVRRYRR